MLLAGAHHQEEGGRCLCVCVVLVGFKGYLILRPDPDPAVWRPHAMPQSHICYPPDKHNNCSKHESWFECTYMYKSGIMPQNESHSNRYKTTQSK